MSSHNLTNKETYLLQNTTQGLSIILEKPSTSSNFLMYNRLCSELDHNCLIQPINEAEFDSETQVCVDNKLNGFTSFYDHYTTKPTKKKGLDIECEHHLPSKSDQIQMDFLQVPPQKNIPNATIPPHSLNDPVVRRLATGAMPPFS
ncbi:unnamed protein product [Phytomonas sp. Hart1]|nr:unnamed protein product [Phytomonas sp. Hart1]|eukprot:CCW67251.1 unnamed protein product [Phytomonas sp. isolate Hart1]